MPLAQRICTAMQVLLIIQQPAHTESGDSLSRRLVDQFATERALQPALDTTVFSTEPYPAGHSVVINTL